MLGRRVLRLQTKTTRNDDDCDNDNRNLADGQDIVTTMDDTTFLTPYAGDETADPFGSYKQERRAESNCM